MVSDPHDGLPYPKLKVFASTNQILITVFSVVFQTAVALAEYRYNERKDKSKSSGPSLDDIDFQQVCDMTRQFKKYLTDVYGADEELRAYRAKARAHPDSGFVDKIKGQESMLVRGKK